MGDEGDVGPTGLPAVTAAGVWGKLDPAPVQGLGWMFGGPVTRWVTRGQLGGPLHVPRCHPVAPGDLVLSLEHPWLCADISPRVSLETRRLLWKPPSSSSLTILFLTPGGGLVLPSPSP